MIPLAIKQAPLWSLYATTLAQPLVAPESYPLTFLSRASGKLPRISSHVLARTNKCGTEYLRPYTWDSQYFIQVDVGTPPQSLKLILDTGSSDLWAFSPQVPPSQQQGHDLYDPRLSSTSKQLENATWAVKYGDGSSSNGNVFMDTVAIGGIRHRSQAVEAAQNVSIEFYGNPRADGIIGFGFSQKNKVKPTAQKTWFDNIKRSLTKGLFTLDLRHDDSSSIDFGWINHTKYFGDILYLPVDITHQGAWGFNISGFRVADDAPVGIVTTAIADSGTSLLITNEAVLKSYYAKVPGATFSSPPLWTFPCDAKLPPFTVLLHGMEVEIPPSYINFGPTDEDPRICYGALESNAGLKSGLSIFGITFLKSLFVVYDADGMRIGFAHKSLRP